MSMFCYQCQEASKGVGCTSRGVCGKTSDVANLQDLLIYVLKGISHYGTKAEELGKANKQIDRFIIKALFSTITNANFNKSVFIENIKMALKYREEYKRLVLEAGGNVEDIKHDSAHWYADSVEAFEEKAEKVGVLSTENEDVRSLRELIKYGLKGIAAYTEHALNLGFEDDNIRNNFV